MKRIILSLYNSLNKLAVLKDGTFFFLRKRVNKYKDLLYTVKMFEPCAMKVACTVLRGGKSVRIYLSQLDTPVVFAENDECYRLGLIPWFINESVSISPQE